MRRTLLATFGVLLACACTVSAAHAVVPTVITLSFDDGTADHHDTVRPMLEASDHDATFYVNSGAIGTPGHMTWDELRAMEDEGNEIGGHTVAHTKLNDPSLTPAQRQAAVCDDRSTLIGQGLTPTSFAYPHGAWILDDGTASGDRTTIPGIVASCGYQSARTTGGIDPTDCDLCVAPLTDVQTRPHFTRALQFIGVPNTAADAINAMQLARGQVQQFASSDPTVQGGWLQLVFHDVCSGSGCGDEFSFSTAEFQQIVDWLKTNAVSGCYVVKTTAEVVAAAAPFTCPTAPVVTPPAGGSGGDGGGAALIATPPADAPAADAPPADTAPVSARSQDAAAPATPSVRLLAVPSKLLAMGIVRFRPVVTAAAGVAKVEYLINGRVVATRAAKPHQVRWTTTSKRARNARLSVRVTDRLGRVAHSTSMTIRVAGRR